MDLEGISRPVIGGVDCYIERDMRVNGATLEIESPPTGPPLNAPK